MPEIFLRKLKCLEASKPIFFFRTCGLELNLMVKRSASSILSYWYCNKMPWYFNNMRIMLLVICNHAFWWKQMIKTKRNVTHFPPDISYKRKSKTAFVRAFIGFIFSLPERHHNLWAMEFMANPWLVEKPWKDNHVTHGDTDKLSS